MSRKLMVVDVNECTGCQLCVIACKDEYVCNSHLPWSEPQPDTGHFWIKAEGQERGQTPKVRVTYTPVLCVHCDNAPCIKACPEGAISKQKDGGVWINPAKCKGDKLCVDACPYDVIYFNEESNVAQKCTWCAHLTKGGSLPRCVDVCPRDALIFGDEDSPRMQQLKAKAEVLHAEYGTEPRVYYLGLPKPFVAGTVVDSSTNEVIEGVRVVALNLSTDEELAASTDSFGDFWLKGLERDRKYQLEFAKSFYGVHRVVVTTDKDRSLGDVVLTRKHKVGY